MTNHKVTLILLVSQHNTYVALIYNCLPTVCLNAFILLAIELRKVVFIFDLKLILFLLQLIPLFTMDLLGHLHGLPGLIMSCVFSGSLRYLRCVYAYLVFCRKDFVTFLSDFHYYHLNAYCPFL